MLLSMYLLYRLVRSAKLRSYMPMVAGFILVVSVLPVIFPLTIMIWVTWPVTFLSFPFFASMGYTRIFENDLPHHIWYYKLQFLFLDITSSNFSPSSYLTECIRHFPFFLVVNILGALLGYWIGKKHGVR
jgi:hypothetical protein